jgi:hypothetical protein
MKKRPRTKFRSNYNILPSLKEKYSISETQHHELQTLIFSGGNSLIIHILPDLNSLLRWIQKNLDKSFTESQLLKSIYQPMQPMNSGVQPNSTVQLKVVQEESPKKKQKMEQNDKKESACKILEKISIKNLIE